MQIRVTQRIGVSTFPLFATTKTLTESHFQSIRPLFVGKISTYYVLHNIKIYGGYLEM